MSPCETSEREGLLEHPAEAFEYFRHRGVDRVICQEKHMGSRAVVTVCRDAQAACDRFGVIPAEGESGIGICYTRTGRRFFEDRALESAFLERIRAAAEGAGLFDELDTAWLCLDCELMPWSAKAQALIRDQYAAVGSAGRAALAGALPVIEAASSRFKGTTESDALDELLTRFSFRADAIERYTAAYRHYCWPASSIDDLRLAPFHLLATEGAVHVDKDHIWHMAVAARLSEHDPLVMATDHHVVSLVDDSDCHAATAWWEQMTAAGGEGMVVKPLSFIVRGERGRGVLQPAVKCRGPEYLRIIYGAEYTAPEHLHRLRERGLKHKRALALREFALGVESLERFVRREPLRRIHECAFAVLALESEPVDPRL